MQGLSIALSSLFLLGGLLAACDRGMEGVYEDELGIARYAFKSDGNVYMSTMGTTFAGEYERDEQRIIIKGPNGTIVLHQNGDTLNGPMGLVLQRVSED